MKRVFYRLHRGTALVFGLAALVVVATGTVSIFEHELDAWARRGARSVRVTSSPNFSFDRAIVEAAGTQGVEYFDTINVFQRGQEPATVRLGVKASKDQFVVAQVDPMTGRLIEPTSEDHVSPAGSLADFFVSLHVRLLVPGNFGLLVTGFVAFGLLFLLATGILFHRPSPSRLRRFRRTGSTRTQVGQLHALLGSWSLPFTGVTAVTGAFLSFATTVLVPVIALVAFGGDQEELVKTVLGPIEIEEKEGIAKVDTLVTDALSRHPEAEFKAVALEDWGGPQAQASVVLEAHGALDHQRHRLIYDGHDGRFLAEPPELGAKPSLGNTAFELTRGLHFGTLFGTLTQFLWLVFGIATTGLVMSGLTVPALRDKEADGWRRLAAGLASGGLLMAFAATGWTWAVGLGLGLNPGPALPWAFIAGALAGGIPAVQRPVLTAVKNAAFAGGLAILTLPLGNLWATKTRLSSDLSETIAVDAGMIGFGLLVAVASQFFLTQRGPRHTEPALA